MKRSWFFQLDEQDHSWGSDLVLIYLPTAQGVHGTKTKNAYVKEWAKQLSSVNSALLLWFGILVYDIRSFILSFQEVNNRTDWIHWQEIRNSNST